MPNRNKKDVLGKDTPPILVNRKLRLHYGSQTPRRRLTRKLDILIPLCSGLAYAHRNGVIHRDIKPANILVDYEGHVRIAGYFTSNIN